MNNNFVTCFYIISCGDYIFVYFQLILPVSLEHVRFTLGVSHTVVIIQHCFIILYKSFFFVRSVFSDTYWIPVLPGDVLWSTMLICYGKFGHHAPFRLGALNICAISALLPEVKMARPFQHQSLFIILHIQLTHVTGRFITMRPFDLAH